MNAANSIVLERKYEATVQELWELWMTKDGFESWWGPEGFRVEVQQLEAREGGALQYDMIADAPEQIEFMKKSGMGISHATRGTFGVVVPLERLEIVHVIDFIPGVERYENKTSVVFSQEGTQACMRITVEKHHDEHMTDMARRGWESQLTKVPSALAGRR